MELRDAVGTFHLPVQGPARIVCLVPSITELVCDLGLSAQLVGRTGFCIHPREMVRGIPKVGGTKTVDADRIRALRPTHVILNIDENEQPVAEALADFVPNLIVTHPMSPLDNLALYRLIGGIFNRSAEAEALCSRFQAAYDEVSRETHWPRKALYVIWKDPWMTISRDTYIARTLALAGLETLPEVALTRYPEFLPGEAWAADVDVVLLSTEPYMFRQRHVAEVAALSPFTGKPVLLIDGEMTSWYGSRAIEGLAYLREFRRSIA